MKQLPFFSVTRFFAIVAKEFIQMRRDRMTFGMMIGIPLMQLILFGFAINSDPKHLPAAILLADRGSQGRTLMQAAKNSAYFDFSQEFETTAEAEAALLHGRTQFVLNIPENFSRKLLRGEKPALLMEADATDPAATGNAVAALRALLNNALQNDLKGPLAFLKGSPGPIELIVHPHYNPEGVTQYNIVPGLMGVVLTLTMVIITGLAITRETESGTMETLLSMPTRPFEVLIGKIIPYIFVGYVQVSLILLAARFIFNVPMVGSIPLLLACALIFIAANLAVGITFSTIARNQRQAMQMAMFFFLPSLLLSGFMFPFRGMPHWAQTLGEILPLTHFLRVVRGILLKGSDFGDLIPELWPISLFLVLVLTGGGLRYRKTLD